MANKAVSLYLSVRINGKWTFRKAPAQRLRKLSEGSYYLSWYEGPKKKMESVGAEPDVARAAVMRKQRELAYIASGGKVEHVDGSQRTLGKDAIEDFIADLNLRRGKDGYGVAQRTISAYKRRLSLLTEYCPGVYLDEVDSYFLRRGFLPFLRDHTHDFGDRTVFNIMLTVNTFLRTHNISCCAEVVKGLDYAPKIIRVYSGDEMKRFFAACTPTEKLTFLLFLNSGAREQEMSYTEVRDLDFVRNVLHVCGKPDRGFRLKGKKGKKSAKDRFIPIPANLMAQLKNHCEGKGLRDLVFTNSQGNPQGHFLRMCEQIAARAGFDGAAWELHRWRKTFATMQHEKNGVSVNTLRVWLGHESLDVTLAYLKGSEAAEEHVQEQVNNGALAEFV
jgi:integrase